jgi:hypothetical protein
VKMKKMVTIPGKKHITEVWKKLITLPVKKLVDFYSRDIWSWSFLSSSRGKMIPKRNNVIFSFFKLVKIICLLRK